MVNKTDKFIVLKIADCNEFLSAYEQNELALICDTISLGRLKQNKQLNHYWVVNQDEPYASKVGELIEQNS